MYFTSGCNLPSYAYGSGCMIISRFPIQDTCWHTFSICGNIHRIDQWDHQSGKGIGLCRLLLPGNYGTIDIYVSHFVAQYSDGLQDSYAQQRILQAFESALFIRATRKSALTILLADINSGPTTLVYHTLATLAGLKDAYSCTHTPEENLYNSSTLTATRRTSTIAHPVLPSTSSSSSTGPTEHPSINPNTISASSETTKLRSIHDPTFGIPGNTYASTAWNNSDRLRTRFMEKLNLSRTPSCDINSRLDYILFGSGQDYYEPLYTSLLSSNNTTSFTLPHRTWHVLTSDIRLSDPIQLSDGTQINLSDHSAVYAEFGCVLISPQIPSSRRIRNPIHYIPETIPLYDAADVSASSIHTVPSFRSILSAETTSSEPNGDEIWLPHDETLPSSRRNSNFSDPMENSTTTISPPQSATVVRRRTNTDSSMIPKLSIDLCPKLSKPHIVPSHTEMDSNHEYCDLQYTVNQSTQAAERLLRQAIIDAGVPIDRVAGNYCDTSPSPSISLPKLATATIQPHTSLPRLHPIPRQISFDSFTEHVTLGIASVLSTAANYARMLNPSEMDSRGGEEPEERRPRENSDVDTNFISRTTTTSNPSNHSENRIPEVLQKTADALQRSILLHRERKQSTEQEENENELTHSLLPWSTDALLSSETVGPNIPESPSISIPITPRETEDSPVIHHRPILSTSTITMNENELFHNLHINFNKGYQDCQSTRSLQLWLSIFFLLCAWISIAMCGIYSPTTYNILAGIGSSMIFIGVLGVWFIALLHQKSIFLHISTTLLFIIGVPISIYLLTFTNFIGMLGSLSIFFFILFLRFSWTAITATAIEIHSYQRALDQLSILTTLSSQVINDSNNIHTRDSMTTNVNTLKK